jgi:beta-1,4-N-acetylglucosaminyltransferase
MIVFGSGVHTTEMLLMLGSKDKNEFEFKKYNQVHFVIGHSDTWSMTKIKDFFSAKNPGFDVFRDVPNLRVDRVYRSREVKQSYFTSIFTTLIALAHSVYLVASIRPHIVSRH